MVCTQLRNANCHRPQKSQEKSILCCQGLGKGHPRKVEAYLIMNTLLLQKNRSVGGWGGSLVPIPLSAKVSRGINLHLSVPLCGSNKFSALPSPALAVPLPCTDESLLSGTRWSQCRPSREHRNLLHLPVTRQLSASHSVSGG